MKHYLRTISYLFLLLMVTGCTTIYKTVVDERDLSTIASDTRIKAAIIDGYIADDTIKTLDIFVACYNGHVYLVGEYETLNQKNSAIKIAKKVEDVKTTTTYLLPKKKDDPCGTKVNLSITANVKGKLIKDTDIWSTNVDVKTVQCNVVLVGLVGSKDEKQKAVSHAKSVEGVRSVKSFLKSVQ